MPIAHLEDRAVLAIAGPEARAFLQGLITNDVERLKPGEGIYAALLTPQGKILFDFFLVEGDAAILLDCHVSVRDALLKRLTMYKLRAKVTIEARDQLAVLAEWEGEHARYAIAYEDPRLPALGARAVIATAEMHKGFLPASAYHSHRIALGVPEAGDFGSDKMFALDADLDELHAIDFAKGCYVGQELTARMKHRATSRKRLLPVDGASAAGDAVTAGGKEIGEVVSAGFALVRLDKLDEAGGAPVSIGSIGSSEATLIKPAWLFP